LREYSQRSQLKGVLLIIFAFLARSGKKILNVDAVLLATNHKTVEVKVAPIECDLEQVVQRGDAAVAARMEMAPNRRVDLEEQDVEPLPSGANRPADHDCRLVLQSNTNSVAFFQCVTNSIAHLLERSLRLGQSTQGVQEYEVMDCPVVPGGCHWNTGVRQSACVRFTFVAKRVILGSDKESRWQTLEFVVAGPKHAFTEH